MNWEVEQQKKEIEREDKFMSFMANMMTTLRPTTSGSQPFYMPHMASPPHGHVPPPSLPHMTSPPHVPMPPPSLPYVTTRMSIIHFLFLILMMTKINM